MCASIYLNAELSTTRYSHIGGYCLLFPLNIGSRAVWLLCFMFFFHAASTGSETLFFLCGSLLPVRRWRTIVCRGKTCNPTARSWCGPASFQSFTTSKLPSCTRLPGNSYRSPKKRRRACRESSLSSGVPSGVIKHGWKISQMMIPPIESYIAIDIVVGDFHRFPMSIFDCRRICQSSTLRGGNLARERSSWLSDMGM